MMDLGPAYEPDWTGRPPGMQEPEALLWAAWRRQTGYRGVRVWYNIGLGEGPPVPPDTAPQYAAMWRKLNQKRADALIEHAAQIELVEVRVGAQASAVGRLLMYRRLLRDDWQWPKPLTTTLVTNEYDREIERLVTELHWTYTVV